MAHKIQEIFNVFDAIMLSNVTYMKVSKPIMQITLWQELKIQQSCLSMHLVQ
jgi:hypothetical protein